MKGLLYWSKGKRCFQAILVWLLLPAGAGRLPAQSIPSSDVAGALWPGIEKRLEQDGGDTSRYFILRQVRSRCGGNYDCLYVAYYDIMIRLERRFDLPAAIYVGEELARVAARRGGPEAEARACKNLSRFYSALGNERLAIVNLERALRLFEQAGRHSEIIRTKMSLLEHSLSYRKVEEVLPEMEALLALAIRNKDTSSISYLHLRLILRYQEAGLYGKMAEHVTAIEKIPLSDPIRPGEYGIAIHAALGRADLFMVEKNYGEAERHYQKTLRLCRAEPSRWLEIHVLQSLAKLEWERNNPALAKSYLDTAQVKAEGLGLDELLARNFELKAQAADTEGRYAQALEYTRKKYLHEEKFKQRSAGFDLQKYYLQLEKEQLAAEKRNQELDLNLKSVELRTSRIIIALAFLLAAGLLIGLYKRREGMRALARQNALIRQQAAELKSLDAAKSHFFANVSHELRTPLTLILGPIQSLLKEGQLTEKQSRLLGMASQSGQQLQQLVNEILDLRKLEMGKMALDEKPTMLAAFFHNYFAQFESLAQRRQVDYSYDIRVGEEIAANIDPEKNRRILYNLLSNAFKFTPAGGRIEAGLSLQDGSLRLTVADSGPGIHPDDLPHVFDRFFQAAPKAPPIPPKGGEMHWARSSPLGGGWEGASGAGIGLALCREYARLFGGTIEVESTLGQGAVFRLEYPVSSASSGQPAVEKAHRSFSSRRDPVDRGREGSEQPAKSERPSRVSGERKPTILVVEDNPGLQDYIRLILSEKYEVVTAENGKAALDCLAPPLGGLWGASLGLILSDLMMPVMDGYQLLERLKSDDATRHIPVIMLTARAEARDRLQALRIGVDDYLTKPFDEEELLVRIENLLKNRAARLEEVPAEAAEEEPSVLISEEDQQWLEAFETYVQQHLGDDTLSVPVLASRFAMSESTLLRQLKRLAGLSPVQYLKEMRLGQARQLLEHRTYNSIARVAEEVGYADARSFSRSYKNRFGKLPSDLLEKG